MGHAAPMGGAVLPMSGPSALVKYRKIARSLHKVPSQMSGPAAIAITRLWKRTYQAGQDPYGKALPPLAPSTIRRKGHGRIMIETGATLDATEARPMPGAGVQLRTGPKAEYHLEPTANRPARPEVPLYGLPPTWIRALKKIGYDAAKKAVRGG